jgi:hypothetical protein
VTAATASRKASVQMAQVFGTYSVNTYLTRWARKKYKRLRGYKRFREWWTGLIDREPGLFIQWNLTRAFDWNR